jgi:hypothetical protein
LQTRETSSIDVQLLLWAVGEARDRGRERTHDRSRPLEAAVPPGDGDFFTEWQPTSR